MIQTVAGFILLSLVVIIWVGSSTLIQEVQENFNFEHPFLLTYFSTSLFSLYTIDILLKRQKIQNKELPSVKSSFKHAAMFFPIYFLANYLFNFSLINTSIASTTIISSTTGVITYTLSIFLVKAKAEILKFVAVLFSLGGIASISYVNSEYDSSSLIGNAMALISAILYSFYCILLSAKSEKMHLPHMYACLGLINTIGIIPVFPIFNYSGLEPFIIPSNTVILLLLLNGIVCTMFSELLWAYSIKYLNAPVCTFGSSLTIPLSLIIDYLLYSYTYQIFYLFGAIFIVLAFFIMALFEHPVLGPLLSNRSLKKFFCKKKFQKDLARTQGKMLLESSSINSN